MAKTSVVVIFVLGTLLASLVQGQEALTSLQVRDGSRGSGDSYLYNVSVEILKDDATKLNITLTYDATNTDKGTRPPKLTLRRFLDSAGSLYVSPHLTESGAPTENPKNIITTSQLNTTGLKSESTACVNYTTSEKDVKLLYLCHLEIKAYYGGEYMLSVLEIKIGNDDKFKAVRHIPVYDKLTEKLTTGGYSQISSKLSNMRFEPSEMCAYPRNHTIRDNTPIKVLVQRYGGSTESYTANSAWLNQTVANATHLRYVYVSCGNVTKWIKVDQKIGKLSAIPAEKAEKETGRMCLELDLKYWTMQNQLQYRQNCTASFKFVLGDEKNTYLLPPITPWSSTSIQILPKKPSGGLGMIMVGALTIFLILLVVFVILYFRNKNKSQGYEESLAKPLNESSPYYELKSN